VPATLTRRSLLTATGTAAAVGLSACSPGPRPATDPAAGDGTRTVQSVLGPVEVPLRVERVVVTEGRRDLDVALALGLPLVGFPRDAESTGTAPRFAPELRAAEAAGASELFSRNEVDLEAVAAADPDLVLGRDEDVVELPELGRIAPVLPLGSTSSGVRWQDDLRVVAAATGTTARAEELLAAYDAKLRAVRERHAAVLDRRVLMGARDEESGGISLDAGRLAVLVLSDLGAAFAPALAAVLPDGDADHSAENLDEATAGADLLVLVSDTGDLGPFTGPTWDAVPALAAGRYVVVDKFVNEGGPLTALSFLDTLDELYASAATEAPAAGTPS